MGENQERAIVGNMIVAPNDVLKDIKEKYFNEEGNLDFSKIIPDKSKWGVDDLPFKTTLEEGRDNLDGAIRFLTYEKSVPNFGRVLSLRYPHVKVAYLSAFLGSIGDIMMVFAKNGKFSFEKHYDLGTRHGRVIYKTVFYGMTKDSEKGKEAEQE